MADKNDNIPQEALGWSWGAFLLTWIWGLGNRVWISLLMFVPLVNIVMWFILGAKGRQWAWQKGSWRDIEHFKRVQRRWAIAGVVVWSLFILLFVSIFAFVIGTLKDSESMNMALEKAAQNPEVVQALGTPITSTGFPSGGFSIYNNIGYADFSSTIQGPKGSGEMAVKSLKDGFWQLVGVRVQIGGRIIDVVPENAYDLGRYESIRRQIGANRLSND